MKTTTKILLLTLCCIPIAALAQKQQTGISKLDPVLKVLVSNPDAYAQPQAGVLLYGKGSNPMVPVIFKCSPLYADQLVAKHQGQLHARAGDIFTAMIPLQSILGFASEPFIIRVEVSMPLKHTNDKARQLTGAGPVNDGALPSGIPYTGKGVLVGIFDTGIDFAHKDFRKKNDSTQTRIIGLWDQTAIGGNPPSGFTYGVEWQQTQLNSALNNPNSINHTDSDGHGTHVAGSAAGLRGMAPDAELLFVKGNLNYASDSSIVHDTKFLLDGMVYFYNKAVALNKPCVVNLSIAITMGAPRDGSSLVEQGFDNLVNSRNGFIICVGEGNNNGDLIHFGGFNLTKDSVWTYGRDMGESVLDAFFQSKYDDSTFISVLVDSAEFDTTWNSISQAKTIYQTPWMSIAAIKNAATSKEFQVNFGNGDSAAIIRLTGSAFDTVHSELRIHTQRTPKPKKGSAGFYSATLFKIALKGKGVVHSWWSTDVLGEGSNPENYKAETNTAYLPSDNFYVANILGCGKKVFAVGAYVNKVNYRDINHVKEYGANYGRDSSGSIARFSSLGITTDGRIKPDFCAPGVNVASSLSRSATLPQTLKQDPYTIVFSGTSMASPIAAGAIALYLEQNPQASFDQVKNAILASIKTDSFTKSDGPLPNKTWGYGKLDIFKAMGGIWPVGIEKYISNTPVVQVFPNPSNHWITFTTEASIKSGVLSIYDISGRQVTPSIYTGDFQTIDASAWNKGIYFYRITGVQFAHSAKIVVE